MRALLAAILTCVSLTAPAQQSGAYPDKPIRVVVPFAAGTGTDILARIITEELRASAGWNFVTSTTAPAAPAKSRPSLSPKRTPTATRSS